MEPCENIFQGPSLPGAMLSQLVTPQELHCVLLGCFVPVLSFHNRRGPVNLTLPENTHAPFHKLNSSNSIGFLSPVDMQNVLSGPEWAPLGSL